MSKTASELATEYWNKPPKDRINNTVQDYVFDYQQAKIDALLNIVDKYKYSSGERILKEVKELLK